MIQFDGLHIFQMGGNQPPTIVRRFRYPTSLFPSDKARLAALERRMEGWNVLLVLLRI